MATLLAIVDNPLDAVEAAQAGVDRIAIDERRGPSSPGTWTSLATRSGTPISLLLARDTLRQRDPEALLHSVDAIGADEVRLPFGEDADILAPMLAAAGHRLIVTASAAQFEEEHTFDRIATSGATGVMVADPVAWGQRLLDDIAFPRLAALVEASHACGLTIALSGALESPDVPRLLALRPDELAFDQAVRAGRAADDPSAPEPLRLVRDLMRQAGAAAANPIGAEPDRIFVRDWVLSISIGAYAGERGVPQRVRFSVEAEIARPLGRSNDLRDVVSYDLITDAIRRLVVAHVDLVETLAERIAETVLSHRRVTGVTITVEKLDLGPGAVGCRITRRR